MSESHYKEHTLPSGFVITLDYDTTQHPRKHWVVTCINPDEEVHWQREFADKEAAEKEYIRFD